MLSFAVCRQCTHVVNHCNTLSLYRGSIHSLVHTLPLLAEVSQLCGSVHTDNFVTLYAAACIYTFRKPWFEVLTLLQAVLAIADDPGIKSDPMQFKSELLQELDPHTRVLKVWPCP